MKKITLILTLVLSSLLVSSFMLMQSNESELRPAFGTLENGHYTHEEILSQEKIQLFKGNEVFNEFEIIGYTILLVPNDEPAKLIPTRIGREIHPLILEYVNNSKTNDKVVITDILYDDPNLGETKLEKSVTLILK